MWLLEGDQWLSFNLGLFVLEKERALSLLCCMYTHRAKGGLRLPPPLPLPSLSPSLSFAYSHSTRPSERQGRFSDVHVNRALRKPFDVPLLFFEGTAERLEDFWM